MRYMRAQLESIGLIRDNKLMLRASELGTWLGMTPWMTPSQLYNHYSGEAPRTVTNKMRLGAALEEVVLKEAASMLNASIKSTQNEGILELPSKHFDKIVVKGHIDALCVRFTENDEALMEELFIIEAKVMSTKVEGIPYYYLPQVYAYHLMHRIPVYFVALHSGNELFIQEVDTTYAEEKFYEWIEAIEDMFVNGDLNMPYAWQKKAKNFSTVQPIPEALQDKVRRLLELREQVAPLLPLQKEMEAIKEEIRTALVAGNYGSFRIYENTREDIDVKRLKEEFPEVYEQVKVYRTWKNLWMA